MIDRLNEILSIGMIILELPIYFVVNLTKTRTKYIYIYLFIIIFISFNLTIINERKDE